MKKYLFIVLFSAIFLFGSFLRFYQLGKVPGSLDWDEVASGYNAYAILLTGKDEYGVHLPLVFRSFGDYKPPLYIYMTVPSVKIFGLTDFAVRFPSALFGSLSLLAVFFLVYHLFSFLQEKKTLSLLAMFFFALSPWSLQFSRGAFEANLALFFVIMGAALVVFAYRKEKWLWAVGGVVLFALSTYAYHSEKLFTPLLLVSIFIWGRKFFLRKKILVGGVVILFLLLCAPWIVDRSSLARGTSISLSSNTKVLNQSIAEINQDKNSGDRLDTLFHNRRFIFLNTFVANYLSHFQPNWLFLSGDLERHHAPGVSLLYLFSLPTILLGIFIFFRRFWQKIWIMGVWFLLGPLPASLAIQSPHAIRSLVFLPSWQIFEALGWWGILFIVKGRMRVILATVLGILFVCNFFYYLNQYFVHTNTDFQANWQYGYKQVMQFAKAQTQGKTYVRQGIEQGYIYYLFYNRIDPKQYVQDGGSMRMLSRCFTIDNTVFTSCGVEQTGDRIISTTPVSHPNAKVEQTIYYANGLPGVYIYQMR